MPQVDGIWPWLLRCVVSETWKRPAAGSMPAEPDWSNYVAVFREQPFGRNILNSVLVASGVVLAGLALGVTAAFALSRVRFRGRTLLLMTLLGVSMFPQVAVLSGLFELVRALERIVGKVNGIKALTIGWDDDVQEARRAIEQAIADIDPGGGVLILTDMFGGTATT